MAESASTSGNSSTSSTSTTGAGSTSTSTSTGNSGAASAGSQSSSNGSFSTGKGNSGNFSGGLPGLGGQSWSSYTNSKGSETGAAHSSGIYGPGLSNGNFGSEWGGGGKYSISPNAEGKHVLSPNAEGKYTLTLDGGDGKGNYSTNNTQYMTVDEVYGKGNQSIVGSQGDYEATSNEKSNVETSTFGKQDEISVTPLSVTEDKGLVNNDAIQSVEGLNFQQKDKTNQEVMEAKKSRDEAEAEDKGNQMRDQLKAVAEKDAEAETDAFQVGDIDEDLASVQKELEQASKVKNDVTVKAQESDEALNAAEGNVSKIEASHEEMKSNVEAGKKAIGDLVSEAKNMVDGKGFIEKAVVEHSKEFSDLKGKISKVAESYGIDIGDISKAKSEDLVTAVNAVAEGVNKSLDNALKKSEENVAKAKQQRDEVAKRNAELWSKAVEVDESFEALRTKYNDIVKSKFEEAPVETSVEKEAPTTDVTTEAPSYKANIEAARNEINNSKDLSPEQKSEATSVLGNVESAADAMNEAANALAKNPNDINAVQQYVEETARYNKALKDAKGNKTLKNTDYNKTFTKAVAEANNFNVTREDGTQQSYAEFAAEMVTKSPELAKGLYEAKAAKLAEDGHKVLAAIENAKSKMVMTWLGSKFTFADNQVRSQFNQMAKTDMRATYATYNNVLNDPNATPEQKAEASAAINQANSLMTASAALQASTGFLSGIGDGTSDGVYGVTDPNQLTVSQQIMNSVNNYAKIALGLGVTPGANEAYQNMYYMAGAKVNESGLFTTDFDGDGFALCQEYGNNAAVGMIAGAGELATGVALMFNPATFQLGLSLTVDSVQTFLDGLYGVQKRVNKSIKYSSEVLSYFNEAESIAAETGNKEATGTISNAIKQIEDFQLKSDEVGNLDNWLEGSGSNTADNGKFNQALTYDEWLKLIEADPTMQEYAKKIIAEKK